MNLRPLSILLGASLPLTIAHSASAVLAPNIDVNYVMLGAPQITSIAANVGTQAGSLSQLIDQSGLSPGYTSLLTDFSPFLNSATSSVALASGGWRSSGASTGILTFTLDDIYEITGIGLWQVANTTATNLTWQIQDFTVWADTDADTTNGLGTEFGSFTAAQTIVPLVHPGQAWGVPQNTSWNTQSTQFIHLQVNSNYGSAFSFSLGEVTFATVPEPLTMLGASAAIAFGAAFKRKTKG